MHVCPDDWLFGLRVDEERREIPGASEVFSCIESAFETPEFQG